MWDILITIGNLIILPAMLGTAINKDSYVPRFTSGLSFLGVLAVVVGLLGAGLIFSTLVVSGIAAIWGFIFLFRGEAPQSRTIQVQEEPLIVEEPVSELMAPPEAIEAIPSPLPPV